MLGSWILFFSFFLFTWYMRDEARTLSFYMAACKDEMRTKKRQNPWLFFNLCSWSSFNCLSVRDFCKKIMSKKLIVKSWCFCLLLLSCNIDILGQWRKIRESAKYLVIAMINFFKTYICFRCTSDYIVKKITGMQPLDFKI